MKSYFTFIVLLFLQQIHTQEILESVNLKPLTIKEGRNESLIELNIFENEINTIKNINIKLTDEGKFLVKKALHQQFDNAFEKTKNISLKKENIEIALKHEFVIQVLS